MSLTAPTRLVGSRSRSKATDFATVLLRCHDSKGCGGMCLRALVLGGSTGSVIYTASLLAYSAHNVHVRFWLGDLVIVCLALYLVALSFAALLLIYRICVVSQRATLKEMQRAGSPRAEESRCQLSVKTLRFICLVMAMLPSLAAILGYVVVSSGMDVSSALLLHCGATGNSRSLENRDADLTEFRRSTGCLRTLDQCKGFGEAFPPPSPFVSYLKVLEYELDCTGWCKPHAAHFNFDASEEACAPRLGRQLWTTATATGAPTMAGATVLAALGFLFYSYDVL